MYGTCVAPYLLPTVVLLSVTSHYSCVFDRTDPEPAWRTRTFIHEQSLAGENLIGHSDASRTESGLIQTVVFAQFCQELCWLQTVPPGIITTTDRQTEKSKAQKILLQPIWGSHEKLRLRPRPGKSELGTAAGTYMLYSVGIPQVALCRL